MVKMEAWNALDDKWLVKVLVPLFMKLHLGNVSFDSNLTEQRRSAVVIAGSWSRSQGAGRGWPLAYFGKVWGKPSTSFNKIRNSNSHISISFIALQSQSLVAPVLTSCDILWHLVGCRAQTRRRRFGHLVLVPSWAESCWELLRADGSRLSRLSRLRSGLWPFATVGWPNEEAKDYKKYYPVRGPGARGRSRTRTHLFVWNVVETVETVEIDVQSCIPIQICPDSFSFSHSQGHYDGDWICRPVLFCPRRCLMCALTVLEILETPGHPLLLGCSNGHDGADPDWQGTVWYSMRSTRCYRRTSDTSRFSIIYNYLNSKTVSELILCRLPSRRSTCMVWWEMRRAKRWAKPRAEILVSTCFNSF